MNRLAIFDCDGTLVDSGGNIFAALSSAFGEHGLDVPPQEVSRRVIGLSLVEAMAEGRAADVSEAAKTLERTRPLPQIHPELR